MKARNLIFSLVVSTSTLTINLAATAQETNICSLENSTLVCGVNLKDGGKILDAMANPASAEMLSNAGAGGLVYSGGDEREAFRKSLEANRVAIKKFADRALRKHRRGKMKASAYEAIRTKYNDGMKTYQSGMELYRAGTWQSKTKGIQAD